jgi:hypothetical protein
VAHQAQETFVAEVDGAQMLVTKGQVFSSSHAVVKLDDGRGLLFKPLDVDDKPVPVRGRAARGA